MAKKAAPAPAPAAPTAPAPAPAPAKTKPAKAEAKVEPKPEKTDPKPAKAEKPAKVEKAEKAEKADKKDAKAEKPAKAEKATKKDAKAEKVKPKSVSKSELYAELAEAFNADVEEDDTKLSRKQVSELLGKLTTVILKHLSKERNSVVTLPGLLKIQRIYREATPETQKESRFRKGEMMTVKAKPARETIKVRALKDLKELIGK
jgi:hypothetical protein